MVESLPPKRFQLIPVRFLLPNLVTLLALFGVLTLLPFFWSLLLLRSHGYTADPQLGGWVVFFVMLLVWCADSGAYFVGRAIGRRKLLPAVSPQKTIEGLVGGLLLATGVAAAVVDQ